MVKGLHPRLGINIDITKDTVNIKGKNKEIKLYTYKYFFLYNELFDILENSNNIWVSADWHLNNPRRISSKCPLKISNRYNEVVAKDDVFIFLGDLVDSEYSMGKDYIKDYIKKLNGTKIMVLGNNDVLGDKFYKECGFKYIVSNFIWRDILFTHMPVNTGGNYINVHGHIHGSKMYFNIPYIDQKDAHVDSNDFYPYNLINLLREPNKGCSFYSNNYDPTKNKLPKLDIFEI